jgi:hypothetical protein
MPAASFLALWLLGLSKKTGWRAEAWWPSYDGDTSTLGNSCSPAFTMLERSQMAAALFNAYADLKQCEKLSAERNLRPMSTPKWCE